MGQYDCSFGGASRDRVLTRRNFLGLVGASAAAAFLPNPVWAAFELPAADLQQWQRALFEPSAPRRYLSRVHTDARMHLGGIGTGTFEIGVDGQLGKWQLFNTLRDGQIPFYFGVKAGPAAKLLQTAGGPDWPRISRIEMSGEYPVATLCFQDEELPVKLELETYSPFSPLDTDLSSTPLAVFKFRIHNPTDQAQTVSLAAMLANPVGYAAIGEIQDAFHPCLGANMNEPFREGAVAGLHFRARSGKEPTLDRPVTILLLADWFRIPPDPLVDNNNYAYVSPDELFIPPLDRPKELQVRTIDTENFRAAGLDQPSSTVIWLKSPSVDLAATFLAEIKKAVEAGCTLAISGDDASLLDAYAGTDGGQAVRPDVLFEDFEGGFDRWTVQGTAFGTRPVHGTVPGQQPVSGFVGKGLVNSYVHGDDATGKLISSSFTIERNFIRFLIGGGNYPTTQIRLVVGDKAVRTASGRNEEQLRPTIWNVKHLIGKKAHVEIVDEQKGGWGHINVDQIVFTDLPLHADTREILASLLPIRFSSVRPVTAKAGELQRVRFQDLSLNPDSHQIEVEGGPEQFSRTVGAGKVTLFAGQLLDPARTHSMRMRQAVYASLCSLVGANYVGTVGQSAREPGYGTLSLAALAEDVTALPAFDDWNTAWEQFRERGRFLKMDSLPQSSPTPPAQTTFGALAATVSIPAGGTAEVPFLFTWHYPNKYSTSGHWMGCHYATRWPDARAVLREAAASFGGLDGQTALFHKTFYDSTLPYWLLDCLTANMAIFRHIGVLFRIANGDVYGWEGSNGSCEPTCTHVWGYEQSLARLFPDLEKDMRRIDYFHQQNPDGGINNRTDVPSPPHPTNEHPFTDGHASCILKAWREALNSPDDTFLKKYWPRVKRALEYLIHRDARGAIGQPAGVLRDEQWNTYDEALHGVTTFLSGYYLAALRAGEEWARRMGDSASADHFRRIFETGRKNLIDLCWNGEYFQQCLPDYLQRQGEVGPGCMSDQLIGQWWAHQLGLGYILPRKMVVSSLRSLFKYNWKSNLTGWKHKPRAFAGANDKGLIVCTWPAGGRPEHVMLYSDEVWTGIEYQVAAHMLYEGLIEEAFSIVKGARERYDGVPRPPIARNPWCEIECGGHYTRAMASWSLLLAVSGFHYDGPLQALRFAPCFKPDRFKIFFSAPEAWGSLAQNVEGKVQTVKIIVQSGRLPLKTVELTRFPKAATEHVTVEIGGTTLPVTLTANDAQGRIRFETTHVVLREGEELQIILA